MKRLIAAMFAALVLGSPKIADVGEDMNPHPPFEEPEDMWAENKSLPLEWTVIELTDELYDKLITSRWLGQNLSATPWVLVFVNKENIDSKRAVLQYKDLAHFYEGKVRFAWVDRGKAELLAETFSVSQLPATYLIKNGMAYNYRLWTYAGDLHDYIENEGYFKSTLSFKQPARFH